MNLPNIGDRFGHQIVVDLPEREPYPPGHGMYGQMGRQKVKVMCDYQGCGDVRVVVLRTVAQEGVSACRSCTGVISWKSLAGKII